MQLSQSFPVFMMNLSKNRITTFFCVRVGLKTQHLNRLGRYRNIYSTTHFRQIFPPRKKMLKSILKRSFHFVKKTLANFQRQNLQRTANFSLKPQAEFVRLVQKFTQWQIFRRVLPTITLATFWLQRHI